MNTKETMLLERRLILVPRLEVCEDPSRNTYLNAFLYVNFGVVIENPEYVNDDVLRQIDELLFLRVPSGFYDNPQDTKYFDSDELFLEQVISYFVGYGTAIKRVELFSKSLPARRVTGEEIKIRKYRIIDEAEAKKVYAEIAANLAAYSRPFNATEEMRFAALYEEGYLPKGTAIRCRDNIFCILPFDLERAKELDKKDLVKYSIRYFEDCPPNGDPRQFSREEMAAYRIMGQAIDLVRDCPMTKRQAKYFNKLCQIFKGKKGRASNAESPYRKMEEILRTKSALCAAEYAATQGSLLIRNLRYLLSRADGFEETKAIIALLGDTNPIALMQLRQTLAENEDDGAPRTFSFFTNRRMVSHVETDEETFARASRLDETTRSLVQNAIFQLLERHYRNLPSLGKIYVSEQCKKTGIPTNTSANGKGVDLLPSGSRIPFDADYIRVFCHWDGVPDIDASLALLPEDPRQLHGRIPNENTFSWRTYSLKPFGDDLLCSGDDTSEHGTEYQDLCVPGLVKRGYRYAIAAINGYQTALDRGDIYQGLQIKKSLDTEAWDPKNIEFQMKIVGSTKAFVGFAVDLVAKEIIVLNYISTGERVLSGSQLNASLRCLDPHYLDLNLYRLLEWQGELVERKEDADIVFDAEYQSKTQKVIRPFDVDALVRLVNR